MNSPIIDHTDLDLEDAAFWAVVDSAVSKYSKNSPSPISNNPSPKTCTINKHCGGEVMNQRPHKISRNDTTTVVKHVQRMPSVTIGSECSGVTRVSGEHSLSGRFPTVSLFKEYQNAAMAILEKSDYTVISGNPFIKKTGWRKISFYFNLSYEIKDKTIEFDENRNVLRAEFIVRAYMQGGRFSDGWGSCERREKRFLKPNHDIPSTAETRAKNKACQDLLGIGEYRPGVSQSTHR